MTQRNLNHNQQLFAAVSLTLAEDERFEKIKETIEKGVDTSAIDVALQMAKYVNTSQKVVQYLESYKKSVENDKASPNFVQTDDLIFKSVSKQSNENGSKLRKIVYETDPILDESQEIQENGFKLRKSVNIPTDGSCQFWAVVFSYLIPMKYDQENFGKRFKNLFDESPTGIFYYFKLIDDQPY